MAPPTEPRTRTWLEVALLLAFSIVWFFWGTGAGDFIYTEALRGIVAREMIERGDWSVPTVHHRVYLRKPPLHAWTTAGLATLVGRLDEQVARWPSAALGVLYVMTMYLAGRWFIGRRAGPMTALLGAANVLVLDYGARADLDVGVLAFSTLAIVAMLRATEAARRPDPPQPVWPWWVLAYVAAALGSMWKAPHVLVFLWLACAGTVVLAPRTGSGAGEPLLRRARHLLHPASVLGALGTLAMVFGYGLLLSRATPSDDVGRFVLVEFAARVIPLSFGDLVGVVLAVPTLAIIALPASLLACGLLRRNVRAGLDERGRRTLSLLLAWLIPAGVFLTIVPAKAGRYWFGVLGAVTLLGALAWWSFAQRRLAGGFEQRIRRGIDVAQIVGVLLGVGMAAFGALLWTGGVGVRGVSPLPGGPVMLLCGVLLAGFLCVTLRWPWARRLHRTPIVFGVVLLLIKPAHAMVIAPARCASQSWRPQAARIDEAVPTDATIHVLSDKPGNTRSGEFADFGWYCRHPLRWPPDIDVVLQSSSERTLYLLVREKGRERMIERFGQRVTELLEIPRESDHVWLLRLGRDGS